MSLRFDPKRSLIIVPTRLYGPTGDTVVRLALDTGATESVVNWDVVVFLGYDVVSMSERVQMATGSGLEFAAQIKIKKIEALEQVCLDYPVICHTLPSSATVDGVLGLNFFRDKLLVLDFRTGLVIVE